TLEIQVSVLCPAGLDMSANRHLAAALDGRLYFRHVERRRRFNGCNLERGFRLCERRDCRQRETDGGFFENCLHSFPQHLLLRTRCLCCSTLRYFPFHKKKGGARAFTPAPPPTVCS